MCFACSGWPVWGRPVQTAPPPVKEDVYFIDSNTAWYPDYRTGIHPPAPVYQNIGQQYGQQYMQPYGQQYAQPYGQQFAHNCAPTMPYTGQAPYGYGMNQQYYYPQSGWPYNSSYSCSAPYTFSPFNAAYSGEPPHLMYYPSSMSNSRFYGNTYSPLSLLAAATGPKMVPNHWSAPNCPNALTAQAAMAAEHNSRLAAGPNAPAYMVGTTPADIAAQNAIFAQQYGFNGAQPTTLAPYKPGEPVQFWCRELDGGWTLRDYSEICLGDVSPGHWEKHAISGYFFWVRQPV